MAEDTSTLRADFRLSVLVTPAAIAHEYIDKQRYALLRVIRLLKHTGGQQSVCIALMPEGDEGGTSGLIEALSGSGRALHALSKMGLPIVPAGVWEDDGRLHACFGPPFSLANPSSDILSEAVDSWARDSVMRHIAVLLPPALQGKFKAIDSVEGPPCPCCNKVQVVLQKRRGMSYNN